MNVRMRAQAGNGLVLLLGLVCIYFVPYAFAHPDGHSQSYMVHYSNRVALLLALGFIAVLAVFRKGLGLELRNRADAEHGSRAVLFVVIGAALALVALTWWLNLRLGSAMETKYFFDRYSQQALGLRLYSDLEFAYGPLMFYPQVALAHALRLPVGEGHFLVLMLHWVAGLLLLWYICARLASGKRAFLLLFLLFAGFWLGATVDGAMNYSPLRFTVAPALTLAIFSLWRRGVAPLRVFACAWAGFLALLFFSPEQGLAFALGTILFFGLLVRSSGVLPSLLLFMAGCAAGLFAASRVGVLNSLLNFGGGALDFPLLPALTTAIILLAILTGGAVVCSAILRGQGQSPEVSLAALTLFSLPAAFGRCDPGHLFINTMPLVAIAFCAVARKRGGLIAASVCMVLFLFMSSFRHLVQYKRLRQVEQQAKLTTAPDTRPSWPKDRRLLAPFGFVRETDERTPLPVITGEFAFYRPLNNEVARERIQELAREPNTPVLVPVDAALQCASSEEARRFELKYVFRPFWAPTGRALDQTGPLLCNYIQAHYTPGDFRLLRGQQVWLPNGGAAR